MVSSCINCFIFAANFIQPNLKKCFACRQHDACGDNCGRLAGAGHLRGYEPATGQRVERKRSRVRSLIFSSIIMYLLCTPSNFIKCDNSLFS